jgi:hypothetical protein
MAVKTIKTVLEFRVVKTKIGVLAGIIVVSPIAVDAPQIMSGKFGKRLPKLLKLVIKIGKFHFLGLVLSAHDIGSFEVFKIAFLTQDHSGCFLRVIGNDYFLRTLLAFGFVKTSLPPFGQSPQLAAAGTLFG